MRFSRRWDWYSIIVVIILMWQLLEGTFFGHSIATQADVAFIGLALVFMLHD